MVFAIADETDGSSSSARDEWWMIGKDTGYTRYTNANGPANLSDTTVYTTTLPSDVTGGAIVVGDSVFIHPYNYYSAKIYELNALNISEHLSNSSGTYTLDGRSLVYYNSNIYMHSSGSLYQINASNVSQLLDTESIGDYGYYAAPTIFNNAVYVGTGNYNSDIDRFNATNISHVFETFNSPSRIYESTPVLGDYAYGASSGKLYQFNVSDITQTIDSVTCYANSVEDYFPVSNNYVYKKCTDGDGSNARVEQRNASAVSQLIASFSTASGRWYALSENYLYFGSGTTFYQLSATNISQQYATYTLATSISAAPAVNDDYVYVPAGSTMYQLSASNVSNLIGTYATSGTINSPVAIAKGYIYFGSNDNKLYQLGSYNPLEGVEIISPTDNGIYTSLSEINYTIEAELEAQYCWWSNSSGDWVSDPISAGTNFTNLSPLEGWNNWTVYCNNSDNTVYNSDVGFAIDNILPYFHSITNQTLSVGSPFSYTLNGTDTIEFDCYSVNDSTNFDLGCDGVLSNNTYLDVGLYWLNITLNDTVNNLNSSLMWVNVTAVPSIGLDFLTPLANLNVTQNSFFGISVNVSCYYADCDAINITLDPTNSAPRSCSDVWGASCEGSDPTTSDYSYDSCSAGSYYSSGFWVDETTVSATSIALGETLNITCTYDCYSTSSLNDLAIMYYNGTWNKIWRQDSACTDGNYSTLVVVSGDVGEQYARCSIGYNSYPNDAVDDTCFDTTYSDNDDVNFTVVESTKSGTISMVEGDTPFYTNITNPYNLSLTLGESQVITWWVNSTGDIGIEHSFFIYANKTSDMSISNISSKWNVTIRDLTTPILNITYPLNLSYDISINDFNYTYFDTNGGGNCWYSKDNGATNSSLETAGINFTSLDSGGGIHNWTVFCNDSSGNLASESVVFTSTIPVINLTWISPTDHFNVTQNQFFQVQAKVTCLNNDCGEVNISLDPILGTGTNYTAYNNTESLGDAYEWEEIIGDGGVALWATGQTSDDSYKTATLDIDFPFFDSNYSTAYVSSNGRIHFTTTSAGSTSLSIPSSSYKLISPVNNDMYVVSATQVYYKNATNPNRAIIQYTDLAHYSYRSTLLTYQVILYEDGKIKIQYHPDSMSYYASRNIGLNYDSSNYLFLDTDAPDSYNEMAVTFLPPGYASGKSGLISTIEGTTPFYTNGTNPYNLTLNQDESTTISWWVNATGTVNETYEFFVFANKTSQQDLGDITSKLNLTILSNGTYVSGVDETIPTITFLSPTNNTYSSNTDLDINYSVSDSNLDSCWYSNDTMSINISSGTAGVCNNIVDINWTEGRHNITIWANDTAGNIGNSSIIFTIDVNNPNATIISPVNDTLNLTSSSHNFTMNFTDNIGVENTTLFIYNSSGVLVNQTFRSFSENILGDSIGIMVDLADGIYTWFYKLFDWAGNNFITENRTLSIDTTSPIINFIKPTNNTYTNDVKLDINYSTSDFNLSSCWYSNDTMTGNFSLGDDGTCANITDVIWSEGKHNLTIWANDSGGYESSSSIVFTVDLVNPNATLISPENNTFKTPASQNFTVNLTDNRGIKNTTLFIYNVTGELVNQSFTNFSEYVLSSNTGILVALPDGNYTWSYRVFDWAGNNYSNLNNSVIIDATEPAINILTSLNNTYANHTGLAINYTVSDTFLDSCWYSNDTYTGNTSITCGKNITSVIWTEGKHNLTIWANDSAGNENSSVITFAIDLTSPEEILVSPNNNTYQSSSSQNFTVNLTDNIGIKNATLFIYNSSGVLVNQTSINFSESALERTLGIVINLVDGVYTWFYEIFDWAGNNFVSINKTVTIDTTPSAINIIYPSNNTFTNNLSLDINYSVSDLFLDSCWYSNDSMSGNTTLDNCANITDVIWIEGHHNITIWANDSAGNENSSSIKFAIDTVYPTINISLPLNGTTSSDPNLDINFTYFDENIGTCWYSNDSMSGNTSLDNCVNISSVVWLEGNHNLTIWINDSMNYINSSSLSFTIESTPPLLEFISPTPVTGLTQSQTNVEINVSILESDLDTVIYNWNETNYTIFNSSMILMYNFENNSDLGENNTYVVDLTGNGNNGLAESDATYVSTGKYGGSFNFDGSLGQLDMGDVDELDGTEHFTISAWVKYDSIGSWDYVISKRDSDYTTNSLVMGTGGAGYGDSNDVFMRVTNGSSAWAHTTDDIIDTNWHHWTMVYDGTQATNETRLKFYFDGIQRDLTYNANVPTTTASNSNPLVLSGWHSSTSSNFMNGNVDELRIWDRSLDSSEIYPQYVSNLRKFNSTQWYLYVNQSKNITTSLDDATYSYFVSARDDFGNENNTVLRNISIDSTFPQINFTSPTLGNGSTTTNSSFEINLSISEANLNEIIYSWNNTNYTYYNNSLMIMYNFDNVSALGENSSYVVDLSSNNYHGLGSSDARYNSSGKYGGSFMFDGVDDYIEVNSFDMPETNFAVSFWFKTSDPNTGIFDASQTGSWGYHDRNIYLQNGNLNFRLWAEETITTTDTYNDDLWHHTVALVDENGMKLYVDGSLKVTGSKTSSDASASNNIIIGYGVYPLAKPYYNGSLDEFKIWNNSLSANDVYQQYVSNLNKINSTQWYLYVNQSLNSTTGLVDGDYTYFVSSKDNVGNINLTTISTITIDSVDVDGPIINFVNLENNSFSSDVNLIINYTVTDLNLDACWYSNDTMSVNISLGSGGNCSNITNVVWNEGSHNLTVWANDTLGNEASSITSFTIDTNSPVINYEDQAETDESKLTRNNIYVNVSVTEINEVNITYNLYYSNHTLVNSSTFTDTTRSINWTGLSETNYNFNVTVYDNATNSASTLTRTVSIDTTNPLITIDSPFNQNYIVSSISYNISSNENLSSCVVSIDDWVTNSSLTLNSSLTGATFTNLSVIDSTYTARFWCNDTFGNINNTRSVNFTIDTNSPVINYEDQAEADEAKLTRDNIYVNVNVVETDEANITFNLYYSNHTLVNSSIFSASTRSINWTSLSDASYKFNVTVYDNSSNSASTTTRSISIDTTNPLITIISPISQTYISSLISFNISSNEALSSCSYSLDNWSTSSSLSLNDSLTGATYTDSSVSDGSYIVRYSCNDTFGNLNNTEFLSFAIDTVNPVLNIISPSSFEYFNYNESIILNYSILTDDTSSCWYNLDRGNNQTINNCQNFTLNLSESSHVVELWVNDSANLQGSDNVNFTIDLTKPSINLITPLDGILNSSSNYINFYYNVSDANDILNCSLIIENDINSSSENPEKDTTNNFTSYLLNSNYAWAVNCTDQANNINISEIRTFEINYSILIDDYMFDGNSTDFQLRMNVSDLRNIVNLTFSRTDYGKLDFLDSVDLSNDIDNFTLNFSKHVLISQNRIEVNSTALSGLNVDARLKLYNLDFTTPQILKDGVVCDDCVEETYTGGTLTFTVEGFSVYSARETPVEDSSSESSSSGSGSSGSYNLGSVSECEIDLDCEEGYTCYQNECVKLFDVEILSIESLVEELSFNLEYLIKGMAEIDGDVIIKFWIQEGNNKINLGQDTIYLGSFEEKTKITTLNLPSDLEDASYDLYVQVNFENYNAESYRKMNIALKDSLIELAPDSEIILEEEAIELESSESSLSLIWFFIFIILSLIIFDLVYKKNNGFDLNKKLLSFRIALEGIYNKLLNNFESKKIVTKLKKKKKRSKKRKTPSDSEELPERPLLKQSITLSKKKPEKINLGKDYLYLEDFSEKEVYSEDGVFIGYIKDSIIKDKKVYGWIIKTDKKYNFRKNILVKKENIQSIGDIFIVDNSVLEQIYLLDNLNKKKN
ncbi:hypothetical protein HN681_03140 [archaeon]|nr:hypothetical protein [archaeon]MBT3730860.1 hypothetical protein [archaeon]MBT4669901.1 hypothetical protein [archaeon]MBT7053283.1 hypothetical protein [archaeon]MBT8010412.1 hypothetical protein [archaeon]